MNRTALITGASRGIGRETARVLAAQGYRLALGYHRSAKQAETLAEELTAQGSDVEIYAADVADDAQVAAMVSAAEKRFGGIDVLVCNAGIAHEGLLTEISPAAWREMQAVHVDGAYFCCRHVLPGMIRRQDGKIVLVSSIWGMVGASCEVAYSAAKAALIGMTKALAKEVGPSQIRVNCVAPGVIDTEMNAFLTDEDRAVLADDTPLGRMGTPHEVAQTIAFLCDDRSSFITGQVISPNGGFVIS